MGISPLPGLPLVSVYLIFVFIFLPNSAAALAPSSATFFTGLPFSVPSSTLATGSEEVRLLIYSRLCMLHVKQGGTSRSRRRMSLEGTILILEGRFFGRLPSNSRDVAARIRDFFSPFQVLVVMLAAIFRRQKAYSDAAFALITMPHSTSCVMYDILSQK